MIKLYLDEDVHKKIATALRLKGYDVLSAHEAGNNGISDRKQLEFAVSEQRAIFSSTLATLTGSKKSLLKREKPISALSFPSRSRSGIPSKR
ncbi:MAG: DUF5615 family PIN-like protein [Parvibaculum sp.]|uniref:DUF5615 family PIN-like protein n=1 Tax=Parvibaculum sp. TaxID=2024848 RepID=UPI00272FA3A3|nr:DUF5615 family PIN-like protein [Parvibaculum sp.]MDP2151610.1 DUF5615 family PIN-like protein [Parvibaculum sp.]